MNIQRIVKRKIRRFYLVYFAITLTLISLLWLYLYSSAQEQTNAQRLYNISSQQTSLVHNIAVNLLRYNHLNNSQEKVTLKRKTTVLVKLLEENHAYLAHTALPKTVFAEQKSSLYDIFNGDDVNVNTLTTEFFRYAQNVLGINSTTADVTNSILPDAYYALTKRLSLAEIQLQHNLLQSNRNMFEVSIVASIVSLFLLIISFIVIVNPIEKLLFRFIDKFINNTKHTLHVERLASMASKSKSQFLSNMSHELRSPISGMFGMVELAQQERDPTKQHAYLQKAQTAGHQLLSLVDEILDISRIEAKVLTFEYIDFELIKVLDNVISPVTSSAGKKGLEFHFDSSGALPDFVMGDPMRLAQALRNILNNAVKFTVNGRISVSAELAVVDKKYLLHIFVSDTGIGIEEGHHHWVFDKFTQITIGENSAVSGAGLGLTIAKEFAEGMGGSLTLNSVIGKGSTFKLSVPLGKSDKQAEDMSKTNAHSKTIKFAVIDDLETSRLYISSILRNENFEVDVFESASKFLLKKDAILDYAGLIIDIHMPGFNGYELAETIQAMFDKSAPPFIFVSASPESINQEKIKFIDVWQAFAKPLDKNLFIDSIRILANKNILKTEAFKPAKVLLVEDEPINAEVVKTMLESSGHEVEVANTGSLAIELAITKKFDLILMDINLPDISGIETTRIIRAKGVQAEIVALTGNAYEEDKLRTKEAGMAYHLVKPVMFHELNNVIKLALRAPE
ncbi:response regulator [uncultured Paraglaciecola sp.]|uniref:response regulator n=1 Tax=uncultured Paraglaciecola sp. TaxID=1765024 RepID=UPI0030DB7B4A